MPSRVHHRAYVLHPLLERGRIGRAVRQPGAALVDEDQPREPGQTPQETRERRLVPAGLEVRHPAQHEDDIDRPAAEHLVGDARIALPRVADGQAEGGRGLRGGARGCRGAVHLGDEPVAAPVRGLDDPRLPGVISERAPDLADADLQRAAAEEHPRPHGGQEVVLPDEAAGARGQVLEHRQRLGRQRDRSRRPAEASGREVELEGIEREEAHEAAHRRKERVDLVPRRNVSMLAEYERHRRSTRAHAPPGRARRRK
jgi:hypothetical protein